MKYRAYDVLEELENQMARVSDDVLLQMFRMSSSSGEVWSPRVDVYETDDSVVVKVCVAGLEPGRMELILSSDGKFLSLRGVRAETDEDRACRTRYHQLEVYYGPFERVVSLPAEIPIDRENLSATYKDGFLKVVLPKKTTSQVNKIKIDS